MSDSHDLIDADVFSHLVGLAALELDQEESEYLRRELNNQLAAIRELQAIQLDEQVPPAAHGVPYPPHVRQPLRPDQHITCENSAEIIAQAPQVDDNCIVMPQTPHTELE